MVNFKLTPRKIRFSLVSSTATALDFTLLLIVTSLGVTIVKANYISSSISFVYSYFASKKFAFKTQPRHTRREVTLFIIITLVGIWVIQPIIIYAIEPLIRSFELRGSLTVIIAKLVASLATFFWNYLFYTRLVFRRSKAQSK